IDTFKQTLKYCMLTYPTIFPSPLHVLRHFFCVIGNGYGWIDGELVDCFCKDINVTKMKYREREEDLTIGVPEFVIARTGMRLRDQAELVQMKWVEENIDAIVEANPTNSYFGDQCNGCYFTRSISLEYAKAFTFPDNIKQDWAEALHEFLQYWLVQLNDEYGPGTKDDDLHWWPAEIREARQAILDARVRLHPYAYNGETYEQHVVNTRALLKDLLVPANAPIA